MTYAPDDTQHDDDTLRWSSDAERKAWEGIAAAWRLYESTKRFGDVAAGIVAPVTLERLREAAERSE